MNRISLVIVVSLCLTLSAFAQKPNPTGPMLWTANNYQALGASGGIGGALTLSHTVLPSSITVLELDYDAEGLPSSQSGGGPCATEPSVTITDGVHPIKFTIPSSGPTSLTVPVSQKYAGGSTLRMIYDYGDDLCGNPPATVTVQYRVP